MSALAIDGELSIYRAAELKTSLLNALAGADSLELDLSQVSEMDSAGLQLLLLAAREAGAADKPFALTAGNETVADVLRLCGSPLSIAGEHA